MMEPRKSVVVLDACRDQARSAAAAQLAAQLGMPYVTADDAPQEAIQLIVHEDGLELCGIAESSTRRGGRTERRMKIEMTDMDLRRGSGGLSRKQPIARAFGPKVSTIVDATAGTGQDAVLLAAIGYRVKAFERSAVLHAMLADALQRAMQQSPFQRTIENRLEVEHGDARERLAEIDPPPDAVYVDPMFPPKKRASALPRKEIQLLRDLVGEDSDAEELFAIAMRTARQRVVVKRPTHAPPLGEKPSLTFEGKLVRYDVYLNPMK